MQLPFGKKSKSTPEKNRGDYGATGPGTNKKPLHWDLLIPFAILFVLSLAELVFTTDTFQYLTRKHQWKSTTEKQRIGFLIFSSVRTVFLSAVYIGFHFARKWFKSMHHTIFLVLNVIFWIISGALIKSLLGVVECGGIGRLKGGLSECHELKIIEILSWVIAVVSLLAAIPILIRATKRRKRQAQRKINEKSSSA